MAGNRLFLALFLALAPLPPSAAAAAVPQDTADEGDPVDTTNVVDLADLDRPSAVEQRLRHVLADHERDLVRVVRNGMVHRGPFTLAAGDSAAGHLLVVRGDAKIAGRLPGNLVVLDGDVRVQPGGTVTGDVLVLNGEADSILGAVGGSVRVFSDTAPIAIIAGGADDFFFFKAGPRLLTFVRLAGTIGMLLTVLALGFAFLLLTRRKLEVVSDTASHAFARSTVAGFVGQILLLPTFGILVVGLVVSIVGILLLPFAVTAYLLLAGVGIAGGYVAAAYAVGDAYTRRRAVAGAPAPAPSSGYRRLLLGTALLAAPWLAWALFGWIPVVGALLGVTAFLVTWLAVSVGFGAVLLSRGGSRADFTGERR